MVNFRRYVLVGMLSLMVSACETFDASLFNFSLPEALSTARSDQNSKVLSSNIDLGPLIDGSRPRIDVDIGFSKALSMAIGQDPVVLAAKNEFEVSEAKLRTTVSGRDTQYTASLLGGIEDVTDETAGIAGILTAQRMLYDGGLLDAKIDADIFYAKAAEQAYLAARGQRAYKLANAWVELERYQQLNQLINTRLAVLDPLLVQLEKVATAGVGDVSQVAAAQRIVSKILVAKADVTARLQQSKVAFLNGFGQLPVTAKYDAAWVSKAVPNSNIRNLAENSPALLSSYWDYRAAEAVVVAVKAQNDPSIAFKVNLQRPFGGSAANSDESIGLALTKNLYQGDQLESQVRRAEAVVLAKAARLSAVYREGELIILSARESINSMDTAIELARINAKSSRKEIDHLRRQLIIGGSTLDSVLSAEARLYEAESQEIGFIAERHKAELVILGTFGYFSEAFKAN